MFKLYIYCVYETAKFSSIDTLCLPLQAFNCQYQTNSLFSTKIEIQYYSNSHS